MPTISGNNLEQQAYCKKTMFDGQKAIRIAQNHGATYCDVRIEDIVKNAITIENGSIEQSTIMQDSGIGIRVLYDGAWGFFSTNHGDKIEDGIISAIKAAKSIQKKTKIRLADISVQQKTINYPIQKGIDVVELTKISQDADKTIRQNPKISKSVVSGMITQTGKYFEHW